MPDYDGVKQLTKDLLRRRRRLNVARETDGLKKKRAFDLLHETITEVAAAIWNNLDRVDKDEAANAGLKVRIHNDNVYLSYAEYELTFYLTDAGPNAAKNRRFEVHHSIADKMMDQVTLDGSLTEKALPLSVPVIRKAVIDGIRRCAEIA